ncbi:MAG: FAD:protein FMN transferase [Lachnospiraceae bacterium]
MNYFKIYAKKTIVIFCVLSLCLLTSCSTKRQGMSGLFGKNGEEKHTRTIFSMDTVMDLTIYGDEEVLDEAEELIKGLEDKLSVTDSASEIYMLNQEKCARVSESTAELIQGAIDLCDKTKGALDISIYPVVAEWGFTTDHHHVPEESHLAALLQNVDYSGIKVETMGNGNEVSYTVSVEENMSIDLGSVTKGYTGELVRELLLEKGVTSALLNLGGNVQTVGAKPDGSAWRIAVTDPMQPESYLGFVEIIDQVVITSGGYQRFFEEDGVRYHHVIDPSTGYPANNGLSSVTIIGDSGMHCDGLSTALFVMGLDGAIRFWQEYGDFEGIFVDDDGNIYVTEGLEGNFSPLKGRKMQVIRK